MRSRTTPASESDFCASMARGIIPALSCMRAEVSLARSKHSTTLGLAENAIAVCSGVHRLWSVVPTRSGQSSTKASVKHAGGLCWHSRCKMVPLFRSRSFEREATSDWPTDVLMCSSKVSHFRLCIIATMPFFLIGLNLAFLFKASALSFVSLISKYAGNLLCFMASFLFMETEFLLKSDPFPKLSKTNVLLVLKTFREVIGMIMILIKSKCAPVSGEKPPISYCFAKCVVCRRSNYVR
mmetsp:Transcript_3190/g.5623  ORF Transcript_3190/g.5623 Transcript_3190/m.5623 type:complete len:239 (-) Transcript_3190:42-758(-)